MKGEICFVECPRDSWQGFKRQIPTEEKRAYHESLLKAGFKHLDLGSFVSPKAVPQMADTEDVLAGLTRPDDVDFLCIVANEKGLERAFNTTNVSSVGYPFSVNESFQQRNTNRSIKDSWVLLDTMQKKCLKNKLRLVIYLSMGFGNPYGEAWQASDTAKILFRLREMGIHHIALADTVGTATPEVLASVFDEIGDVSGLGLHLHAPPNAWQEQLELALMRGMRWFEGALAGIGGCPFAADQLVGNLPTENVLTWFEREGFNVGVDMEHIPNLVNLAKQLQRSYEKSASIL